MFGESALEPQVLDEGSKNVRRVRWIWCGSGRGMFVDPQLRTHPCTVAGSGRGVKHRPPDAPKVTG